MKSIKLLVLSLCGLFSMSSCVNDFLDRDPMDIISEDLVWSNENAVNAYMAGMYEDMFVEPHAWLINWGTLGHYTDESMRSYSWGYPYTPVLDRIPHLIDFLDNAGGTEDKPVVAGWLALVFRVADGKGGVACTGHQKAPFEV